MQEASRAPGSPSAAGPGSSRVVMAQPHMPLPGAQHGPSVHSALPGPRPSPIYTGPALLLPFLGTLCKPPCPHPSPALGKPCLTLARACLPSSGRPAEDGGSCPFLPCPGSCSWQPAGQCSLSTFHLLFFSVLAKVQEHWCGTDGETEDQGGWPEATWRGTEPMPLCAAWAAVSPPASGQAEVQGMSEHCGPS